MPRRAGRKPKPTELHELEGSFRPARHAAAAEIPAGPALELYPPEDLQGDARAVWHETLRTAPAGVLKGIDLELLRAWCEAIAVHRRAALELRGQPLTITGSTGTEVVNPVFRILSASQQTIARLASELGFSPTARPRLIGRNTTADNANPFTSDPVPDSPAH